MMIGLGIGPNFFPPATGAPAFVGALDALVAQGAVLRHASSVRRLRSLYTGPACRLRGNGANNAEADIAFLPDGTLDLAAAAAVAADSGGTQANWVTAYDQFQNTDATQPSASNQMQFGTTFQSRGEMGGIAATNRFLSFDLQGLNQPTFFSIVGNQGSILLTRFLLGTAANSLNRYVRLNTSIPQQNWGTTLAGTSISLGKHVYGFLSNGSSSQIYIDGTLSATGDAGNTQLDMTQARIGAGQSTTNNWNASAGNTISEVIVFSSNPTTLPGWPAFVAAQKTHFGIP
jgi:hypothetical protein